MWRIEIVKFFYRFCFYSKVILIPIGIIGNIISMFIFTRPSFNQKTNTGLLYTLFCGINLILIVYEAAFKYKNSFTKFSIDLPKSIELYIENILFECLSWVQVIISVDRFIAVLYPVKGVLLISKKWILNSIIFGLFIFIVALNSPFFIRISKTSINSHNQTVTKADIMTFKVLTINYYIDNCIRFYIPFIIMVIVDILVIIRLKKSRTHLNQRKNRNVNVSNTSNRSSRFTRNTIIFDLIYLIFNIPSTSFGTFMIIYCTLFYAGIEIGLASPYYELLSTFLPLFSFFYLTLIFLLFIAFNRIFRAEFVTLFRLQKILNIVTSTNH